MVGTSLRERKLHGTDPRFINVGYIDIFV